MDYIDNNNPYYQDPPKPLKSFDLQSAFDNYVENPCDESKEEMDYWLEVDANWFKGFREVKQLISDMASISENATAGVILGKLKNIGR